MCSSIFSDLGSFKLSLSLKTPMTSVFSRIFLNYNASAKTVTHSVEQTGERVHILRVFLISLYSDWIQQLSARGDPRGVALV